MSRVSNALNMYFLLQVRNMISVGEIKSLNKFLKTGNILKSNTNKFIDYLWRMSSDFEGLLNRALYVYLVRICIKAKTL